jgi:hypothetical protein
LAAASLEFGVCHICAKREPGPVAQPGITVPTAKATKVVFHQRFVFGVRFAIGPLLSDVLSDGSIGRIDSAAYTSRIDESEHPALRESACSNGSMQCDGCYAPFTPVETDFAGYADHYDYFDHTDTDDRMGITSAWPSASS